MQGEGTPTGEQWHWTVREEGRQGDSFDQSLLKDCCSKMGSDPHFLAAPHSPAHPPATLPTCQVLPAEEQAGVPALANKNIGHPRKFEFQINHEKFLEVCSMKYLHILTLKKYLQFI